MEVSYFLLRGCAGSICHGGGLNVGVGDTVEVLANERIQGTTENKRSRKKRKGKRAPYKY